MPPDVYYCSEDRTTANEKYDGEFLLVASDGACPELGFDLLLFDGHTEKMALPKLRYKEKTILFASDLFPTAGHIPIPYLMGYDIRPLITMEEKERVLQDAVKNNVLLFMQHDPINEVVALKATEKGVRFDQSIPLTSTC